MIRALALCGVLALAGGMIGCALFGVTTGEDGKAVSDGTGGIVGRIAGTLIHPAIPGAIAVLAGGFAAYKNAGEKKAKAGLKATLEGNEEYKKTPEGKAAWEAVGRKIMAKAHENRKVKAYIDKLLGNDKKPSEPAKT